MNRSKTLRSAGEEQRTAPVEAGAGDPVADAERVAPPAPTETGSDRQAETSDTHLSEEQAVLFITGRLSDARRTSVERHLEHCASCRSLVSSVVEWGDSTRDRRVGTAWRGSVIPRGVRLAHRYRVQRFVARGGMGEVYDVMDEALGERIALKTVASQFADDHEAISQLKAEVQMARRVSHKNVCRIFDIGTHESDDGPPLVFLTMEYIDGQSLGDRIRRDPPLGVREARRLATGILEGLNAVHEAGVLHRDLKSDNVMLRSDRDGRLSAVLMDFGLASALNPNSSRVSGDRALVGSLAYMAPEQVQGEALRVTTDVYAFGVILFEMLTRRLPFVAATPALAALKRLQQDAPRLRSIDSSLPLDLDDIVARCLERDPRQRYASARDVLADLAPSVRLRRVKHNAPDPALVVAPHEPAATAPGGARELAAAETADQSAVARETPATPSTGATPSTQSSLSPTTVNKRSSRRSIAAIAAALVVGVSLGASFFRRDANTDAHDSAIPLSAGMTPPAAVTDAPQAEPVPDEPASPSSRSVVHPSDRLRASEATRDQATVDATQSASAAASVTPSATSVSEPSKGKTLPPQARRFERPRPVTTPGPNDTSESSSPPPSPSPSASSPGGGSVPPVSRTPEGRASEAKPVRTSCPPGLLCPDKLFPPPRR